MQQGTMTTMERWLWGVAALGFVVPNAMVTAYLIRHGLAIGDYLEAWTASLPSIQLMVDLGICALAFLTWAWFDARRHGIGGWWWSIAATFLVGLCFGIPLYLAMRERALRLGDAPGRSGGATV